MQNSVRIIVVNTHEIKSILCVMCGNLFAAKYSILACCFIYVMIIHQVAYWFMRIP